MGKTTERPKEKWARNIDFVFNMAGMAIGLGNIWRFPYLCYKNGGGTFLVPYLIFVLLVAFPMSTLEVSLGQLTESSGPNAWRILPLMKGIGYATFVLQLVSNIYYPILLAWALRYLVASFSPTLPWMTCDNEWNTENCSDYLMHRAAAASQGQANGTSTNFTGSTSSSLEFWKFRVLGITTGVEDLGDIKWDLCGCLFAIWVGCYFCIWKGVKWTSKVIYLTATLPLIMVLVVVIRGVTLDGAMDGIKLYLSPNITRLGDITVWNEAAIQVYFSYGAGIGVFTALASHNTYHHNFYRDSAILCLLNGLASFVCGFAIFSILGFMAKQQGIDIEDVAESGPGLVFISYPAALSLLPAPQFWSVLFFIVLILLGFDGQFVYIESFTTTLLEIFPGLLRGRWQREIVIAIASGFMFLLGLIMITEGGIYVFYIIDYYFATLCLFLLCSIMCVTICWIYGLDKYKKNVEDMLQGNAPRFPFIYFLWKYITPIVGLAMFLYNVVMMKPLVYNKTYVYPPWANALGWLLSFTSLACIPIYATYKLFTTPGKFFEKMKKLTTPRGNDRKVGEESFPMNSSLPAELKT